MYGLLVADGVGGQQAGEVASRTAIQAIVDLVIDTPDWIMRLDEPLEREVMDRMERRFQKVREVLVERAEADPKLRGMATTLTVACSLGPVLLTTHVGDTRAYLFRGGKLMRLTRDQTMAQSLADAGAIRPEEIALAPDAPRADERARGPPRLRAGRGRTVALSKTATGCSSAPTASRRW